MSVLEKYDDIDTSVNLLSKEVVDCIFQVHQKIEPGYLEKIYEDCLCIELEDRGIQYQRQCPIRFVYNGRPIITEFRFDLVIDNKILVELKAVEKMHPVFEAQMYSYLNMSGFPMGFLVNFNVPLIKDGIKRYIPKNLRSFGTSR
jgi:GxxExxY protein